MIYAATSAISSAFHQKDIKHRVGETSSSSYVEAGFSGDNVSHQLIRFISNGDNNAFSVRIYSYLKVPQNKRAAVLECINQVHREYRYVKLSIDSDSEVLLAMDAPLRNTSVGDVAVEYFYRMANIADDIYPQFMKALWT